MYGNANYFPIAPGANQTTLGAWLQNGGGRSSTSLNPLGANNSGGFGFNMDTLGLGIQGLSAIGNFWNAFQAQKLAKQQFAFTKDITETNLANQIKSYNTALSDRARSRGFVEGQTDDQISQYVNENMLTRR